MICPTLSFVRAVDNKFQDFSKVFDEVTHAKLSQKLKYNSSYIAIEEYSLQWLLSFNALKPYSNGL